MFSFTDNMKAIITLADACLFHTHAEKYPLALEDMYRIVIRCKVAKMQLDELRGNVSPGTDRAGENTE